MATLLKFALMNQDGCTSDCSIAFLLLVCSISVNMSTWAKFGMRLYWLEYRVKVTKNHKINQSILVIDHQFKDTHLELIPINSGLNPLYKNV
jgi:hypothetical protein